MRSSGVDTISDLPCNVLEGILGCLPLKDAVKTSVLSKDWRYKWVTRQELDFDYDFFKSLARDKDGKTIIYQVLLLHKGPILKFRLRGSDFRSCSDIDHWILFLSKKDIQEFTLYGSNYHLPSRLFTFKQLRHLELYGCLFHPPPSFRGFEKLVNLDFQHVTFVPTTFRILISGCPLLKRLTLIWCTDYDDIEIDAANLKCFEFRGRRSTSICFMNTPMLRKVSVYFISLVPTDASPDCSNLAKLFHYTPSLQELELGGPVLEYLTIRSLPENPPTALNNVKSLNIPRMYFRNVEEVSGAVYLITSCPKLQELTINCTSASDVVEPVIQLLRAQSVPYGFAKLLRRVEMSQFAGHETEMEFVKFILASAPVLEEIFVWNYGRGTQMMEEMKQFYQASPKVEFIFDDLLPYEPHEVMEVPEDLIPIEPQEVMEVPEDDIPIEPQEGREVP